MRRRRFARREEEDEEGAKSKHSEAAWVLTKKELDDLVGEGKGVNLRPCKECCLQTSARAAKGQDTSLMSISRAIC